MYLRIFGQLHRRFSAKNGQKLNRSDGFWLRRQASENFRIFRAIIPSQSTNFNPKLCNWLELGGGLRPPRYAHAVAHL